MRLARLWSAFLVLFLTLIPRPALALSCMTPDGVYDTMAVVVRATVVARPAKDQMVLTVDRYHRGSGPATLTAHLTGIEPGNAEWMPNPELGGTYLIGMVIENGRLVTRPCDILMPLADALNWAPLAEKLGEGQKPDSGAKQITPDPSGVIAPDQPATDQPATEEPATEKPGTEKPATEEPAPTSEKPAPSSDRDFSWLPYGLAAATAAVGTMVWLRRRAG